MKINILKNKRGFTLIELLVVITIIGILTTVIATSLSRSRSRAYDTKIKQQLIGFRTSAYLYYYNQTPYSYGISSDCSAGVFIDTNINNGSPGNYINSSNLPNFTNVFCASDGVSYSVKATLYDGESYFCVDSRGSAKTLTGTINLTETSCP